MFDSYALYNYLQAENLLDNVPEYWWPNAGTFQIVLTAILGQNTTWLNVEKSMDNLQEYLTLESFLTLDEKSLIKRIHPSGFYNQKAPRLLALAKNIKEQFSTFENFQDSVTREWLLEQKGIGEESADAILCYGCMRAEMVVDTYAKRVLKKFAVEFKTYREYKIFLEEGIQKHCKQAQLAKVYALFHGMIVEYNKHYSKELKSFH